MNNYNHSSSSQRTEVIENISNHNISHSGSPQNRSDRQYLQAQYEQLIWLALNNNERKSLLTAIQAPTVLVHPVQYYLKHL